LNIVFLGNQKMEKSFLNVFVMVLIGGLAFITTLNSGTGQVFTEVKGIITSDTTWTKPNSPYTLGGNVLVNNGVTLTIEPGVTVTLNGYYIMVNGTLSARGTSADPLYIKNLGTGEIRFTQFSTGWSEQTSSGSIIENAIMMEIPEICISGSSPKISNNNIAAIFTIDGGAPLILNNNIIKSGKAVGDMGIVSKFTIDGGSPIISNNNFDKIPITINGGSPVISNNVFTGYTSMTESGTVQLGTGGIQSTGGNPYISSNTITNCSTAISVNDGIIERNYILNNTFGVKVGDGTVQNNTFVNDGIFVKGSSVPKIIYNNIQSGNAMGVTLEGTSGEVNATYNWWGTTDATEIDQKIWDYKDDYNLGKVSYIPFLTEPNAQAMPDPNAPTPTLTPTPPPTESPSTSPTPTQEPQQPDLTIIGGVAVVAVVLGAGLGLLIYLARRK
jgi:hypothetical protein